MKYCFIGTKSSDKTRKQWKDELEKYASSNFIFEPETIILYTE
jgi:hypothetical protein